MRIHAVLFLMFFLSNTACSQKVKIDNIITPPDVQEGDKVLADVFQILDGTWKGKFTILEDPNPIKVNKAKLQELNKKQVLSSKFKKVNEIEVTQVYDSETPYFQKVNITDFYPQDGTTEKSVGVNKIQNGQMWCVVHKPNDTVIHLGSTKGDDTIIWQSNQKSPQKIEFFQEKVSEKFYEILGYGYYEGDDVSLSPRLWFYGKYERQ